MNTYKVKLISEDAPFSYYLVATDSEQAEYFVEEYLEDAGNCLEYFKINLELLNEKTRPKIKPHTVFYQDYDFKTKSMVVWIDDPVLVRTVVEEHPYVRKVTGVYKK